jgi:hypothetical protein
VHTTYTWYTCKGEKKEMENTERSERVSERERERERERVRMWWDEGEV